MAEDVYEEYMGEGDEVVNEGGDGGTEVVEAGGPDVPEVVGGDVSGGGADGSAGADGAGLVPSGSLPAELQNVREVPGYFDSRDYGFVGITDADRGPMGADSFRMPTYDGQTKSPLAGLFNEPVGPADSALSFDLGKAAENLANQKPTWEAKTAPIFFDWKESQADRYVHSGDMRTLGFRSWEDNEERYAAHQTWGEVLSNSFGGMKELAWNTFADGWAGWGRMADAVFSRDFSKIMGDADDLAELHEEQEAIFNKYAIYASKESEDSIFNRQFLGNLIQQSGFALGAMGQFVTENLVFMGLGNLAKPFTMASTIGRAAALSETLADSVRVGAAWKSGRFATKLFNGLKTGTKAVGTGLTKAARLTPIGGDLIKAYRGGARGLELALKGIGSFRRTLGEFNMASVEARQEAAELYMNLKDQLRNDKLAKTGAKSLRPEEEAEIEKMAMEGATYGYGSNVLLLAVMNRLSMGNLIRTFGMDKRVVQSLAAEGIGATGEKIGRVVTGTAAREIKVGEKVVKAGYKLKQAYGKHYLGALGNYRSIARDFGKVTALKEVGKSGFRASLRASLEGLEEEEQEMIKGTIEDYYGDLGKGKAADLYRSISNAALKQMDFQGAKTFLSGALTGGIVGPVAFGVRKGIERIQKGKNAGEVEKAHKKALDDLNAFFVNPEHYLSKWVVNTNIQEQAGEVMDEAVEKRDKYTYFNAKNIANDSTLWTAVESGMGDALLQHVRDLAKYMPEDQLNEAFGPREKGEWKGYLNKVSDDMRSYINDVKVAEAKFDDYINYERYSDADKKDVLMARTAYRQIIRENVSNRYMIREAQKRKREILEEVTKIPGVGDVSHFAFNVLSNKKVLEGRIALVRQQLASDEQAEDPSDELKQRIARRRKELRALEGILRTDVMTSEEDVAADAAARAAHEEQLKAARGEGVAATEAEGTQPATGDKGGTATQTGAQEGSAEKTEAPLDRPQEEKKKGAVVIMPSEKGKEEAQATGKGAVVIQPTVTGANRASVIAPSAPNAVERQPMKSVGNGVVVLGAPIAKRLVAMRAYIEAVAEENGREVMFTDKDLEDFDVLLEDYRKLGVDVLRRHNALSLQENPRKFLPTFVETEKALNARKVELWMAGQEELKRAAKEQAERLAAQRKAEGKPPEEDGTRVEEADEMDEAEDDAAAAGETGTEGAAAGAVNRKPRSYNGFREGQFVRRKDREGTFYISRIGEDDITFLSLDRGISFTVSKKFFDGLVNDKNVERVVAQDVFGSDKFGGEMQLMPESRGGLFVVKLNKKDEAYMVADRNMNYVNEGDIDARRIYIRRAQAGEVLNAVLEARAAKEEQQSFVFDGKRLRVGDVLEDKNGKEYRVNSKVREVDGKEMIHLLREDTDDDKQVTSLKRFRLKRKAGVDEGAGGPSATPQDDKKRFRIRRPKILMSVYAHVRDKIVGKKRKDLTSEEAKRLRELRKEAEAELSALLRTTPQEELQKKLTIHIRRNTDGGVEMAEEGGPFENRNLRLNPEPYTVELRYEDRPIGYLTYYNRYQYQDAQGKVYDTDKLTKAQFAAIFDTSRGQQVDMLQEEFKRAYREGKKVYQVIEGLMEKSKGKEVVLAGEQLQGLFDVNVGFGSYDWLAKGEEPVVELKDFGLNSVGGRNVVLVKRREYVNALGDWRVNEVMVTNERLSPEEEADLRDRIKEARVNEEEDTTRDRDMGSYIAVVELPNGKLRFLDLAIPPAEASDLAKITEQLNQQMEKTRRENVLSEDEVNDPRFNEAFNEEVLGKIFVATYLGQKGLYIKPELNEYGEIKISYWNDRRREEGVVTVPTQEGKPFGSFQEVLDAMNKAIAAYNAEEPTGTRLSKVEIKLEHIKKDISADAGWDELQHLRVKVGADVVRNVGMSLRTKKAQGKQKAFDVPTVVEPPTVSPTGGQGVGKGAAVVMPGISQVTSVTTVGDTAVDIEKRKQELGLERVLNIMPPDQSGGFRVILKGDKYEALVQFDKGKWLIYPKQADGSYAPMDPATGQLLVISNEDGKRIVERYLPKELVTLLETADATKGPEAQEAFMKGAIATYLPLYRKEQLAIIIPKEKRLLGYYKSDKYPNKEGQPAIIQAQEALIANYEAELAALKKGQAPTAQAVSGKGAAVIMSGGASQVTSVTTVGGAVVTPVVGSIEQQRAEIEKQREEALEKGQVGTAAVPAAIGEVDVEGIRAAVAQQKAAREQAQAAIKAQKEKALQDLEEEMRRKFERLVAAKTPVEQGNAIMDIQHAVNRGVPLSVAQQQVLYGVREKLEKEGYRAPVHYVVPAGDKQVVIRNRQPYQGEILSYEQLKPVVDAIMKVQGVAPSNVLQKETLGINLKDVPGLDLKDLPGVVSRIIKPRVLNKAGEVLQEAEVDTVAFSSLADLQQAIDKSHAAGFKVPNVADEINAQYEAALEKIDFPTARELALRGGGVIGRRVGDTSVTPTAVVSAPVVPEAVVPEVVDPRVAEVEAEKEAALAKVQTGYYQIAKLESGEMPSPFRSVAMYGDGILVFTGNAAYVVRRYGQPMEGEVQEDDFVPIDATLSPAELYKTLKSEGYAFAEDHSLLTGDMLEFPTHGEAFFADFRKSNPQVKGVRVMNHTTWGGMRLSDFFVVYKEGHVHEAGALTDAIEEKYDKQLEEVEQQVAAEGVTAKPEEQKVSGARDSSATPTEKPQKEKVVVLRSRGVKGPVAVKGVSDALMAAEMLVVHRNAIEASRDEELRAIGLGDVAGGLEELRKAKTVLERANVLNAIEHSVQEGAELSAAQEQELSAARELLEQEGYEVVSYAVVPNEVDVVVNPARAYQGEILSEEQVELLEGAITKLERRKRNSRLSYDVDDLPEVVARVVRPEVSKDGKVLQAAVLDTLRFDSMSEVERAIERSHAAGFVRTRAADEIRAKYDEALENIVDNDRAMLFIEDEGEGFEEMGGVDEEVGIGPSPAAQDDKMNVQVGDAVSDLQAVAAEHEVEKAPREESPSGMDEEMTLEQVFDRIEILERQLAEEQAAVFNELTEGKDLAKVNLQKVDDAVQVHPRVVAMREELRDMETRVSTYKIATSEEMKTADIVHVERFREWMKEHLPESIGVSVEQLADDMLQKGTPVGRFLYSMDQLGKVGGTIQLASKEARFVYHEAFHAVFRLLLNDQQIDQYLAVGKEEALKDLRAKQAERIKKGEQKEAKDDAALLEDALDDLLELRPSFYGRMSREELEARYYEQHMADAFDRWKQDRKVRTPNLYKGLFGLIRRLGDWLAGRKGKVAKGLGIKRSELERLFYDINDRQFKGAAIADNRYTRELEPGGNPHMAWKDIVLGKKKERLGKRWVEREVLMSQGKAADLISSITATVLERKRQEPGADMGKLLDAVFDDYAGLYDKRRARYMQKLREGEESVKEYYRIVPELDQLRNLFLEGREQLVEAVQGHLEGIVKLQERTARDERGVLQDEQVGVANMVPELRAYLSSIVMHTMDDYGNLYFDNGKELMQAVSIEELYTGLQKSGAAIGDIHQMLLGMERFAEYNEATFAFMQRFKEDVGLERNEKGYRPTKNQHLFYMVMKAFEQYTPDHLYFNRDIRRERSYLVKANTYDSVKSQVSLWYNSFMELFYNRLDGMERDDKREFIEKATSGLDLFLDSSQGFKVEDEDLKERATRISNQLKEGLGIDLHRMFILYSLAAAVRVDDLRTDYQKSLMEMYGRVKPLTRDGVQDLHKLLKQGKNPFHSNMDMEDLRHVLEEDEQSRQSVRFEAIQTDRIRSNKTRFFRIGYANSFFDEKIHTARFRAADGTRTNAYQYPDFYMVKARDVLRSLGEDPGDAPTGWMRDLYFGDNHYLLHQKQFRHIADRVILSALDGMGPIKAKLTWERKFGMLAERSRETGIRYAQYTGRDNMSNLIELYFVNTLHTMAKDSKQLKAEAEEAEKQQKKETRGRKPLNPEKAAKEQELKDLKVSIKQMEADEAAKKAGELTEEDKKKTMSFMTSLHRIGAVGNADMVYTAELPVVKVVELRTVKVDENEVLQEGDEIQEETDHTGSGNKGGKKIRKREEVRLTMGTRQAFVNEVQREFDELRRAAKVIKRLKEGTLKEDDEVIEGYHTKGKNGEAPRGLQLVKTGHMLEEDVRKELERLAAGNQGTSEDIFNEYAQVLGDQIEKYWLGEKGLMRTGVLHDLIEELLNTGVIYKEKRGSTTLYQNRLLPYYIRQGYHGAERKTNTERNALVNIIPDKMRHNIAQIVINDYLNTNAFHQFLHGNRSKVSEDPRRMGDQGEAATFKAPSVAFDVAAPDLEIKSAAAGKRSHVVHVRNMQNADGAVWLTPNAYRHMLYGSGKLTSEYVQMLDKIERGEAVEGALPTVRVMYYDGQQDIEAVGVVLLPGQEGEMETLRRKMEAYEKKHKTFAIASPLGSSHGKQSNVAKDAGAITDWNFREMDNKYLRVQMETPVGLTEKEVRRVESDLMMGPVGGSPSATEDDKGQAAVKEHKRLKEVYLQHTADRARELYEVARDGIFGVEGATEAFRASVEQGSLTPQLEDFLRKAVAELEQAGADSQFLSFFSVNEGGEAKYNLNLPQTAQKFEELFTAYFARRASVGNKTSTRAVSALPSVGRRVVREVLSVDEEGRVKETRVIPVSVVEQNPELYSDVLDLTAEVGGNPSFAGIAHPELSKFIGERQVSGRRIFLLDHLRSDVPVYDANGAIVDYYDEYMMGAPNAEVEAAVRKTGEVPQVLVDGFSMRNAGGGGANRVRLVDVLPGHYGSVGVFANREGGNFRFDKDRVHVGMRDTYSRRDGDAFWFLEEVSREDTKGRKGAKGVMSFHAYGETQGAEGEFEEYLVWMARNDERVKEGLKAQTDVQGARERVVVVMQELGLPASADEYRELRKVKGRELNVGRMNNTILDAQMGMAGSKKMATATEQGGIQVAKVLNEVVERFTDVEERLKMEEGLDRDMIAGKGVGFRDKKAAAEQLPGVQEALSVFPYLHGFGVEQRKELSNGEKIWHLKIGGVTFNTYKRGRAYNPATKKFDGPVVGDVLSSLKGAVVNGEVRAQMAAMFDFNPEALSIVGNMVAQGVPLEWAVQFMMQPIIQDYYRKVNQLSSPIKTGMDSLRAVHNVGRDMLVDARNFARLDRIRQEVMKEFTEELEQTGQKLNPQMFQLEFDNRVRKAVRKRRERVVEAMDLSAEMLEENIKDKGTNKVYEYSVFKTFMRMREQAEYHEALQGLLGAIQEPGKGDPKQLDIYIEKLGLLDDDRAFGMRKVPMDLRQLLGPSPAAQDKVNAGQLAMQLEMQGLLQRVLLSRTGLFRDMVESTLANFDVITERRAEAEQTLKTELLGHLTLRAYQKLLRDNGAMDRLWSLSNGLMYNEVYGTVKKTNPGFMNIVEVLEALKGNPALKDNAFVQFLHSIPTHVVMGTRWVTKEGHEVDPAEVKRKEGPPTTFGDDIKMATGIGARPGEVLGAGDIVVEDEVIEVIELPILQENDYNEEGFNQVATNTWSKLNRHEVQKVKEDFLKIYDNKATNSLAWALFHYLLVRDGGQIRSGSFLPYIPNFMFSELSEAMGKVHEVFMNAAQDDNAFKEVFGVSKHELLNRFVAGYVSHPANVGYAPKVHVRSQNTVLPENNRFTKDALVQKYMPRTHWMPERNGQKIRGTIDLDFWGGMSDEVKAAGRELQEEAVTGEKRRGLSAEEERARLMFEKHVYLFKSRMFAVHGFGEKREEGVEEAWDQEDYEEALEDEGVAERKVREGYIEFPFIVKDTVTEAEQKMQHDVYLRLESIDGVLVDSEEAIKFIDETRKVARGTRARYVAIAVSGSAAQSAAAVGGAMEKVVGFGTEAWGVRDMDVPAGFGLRGYRASAKEVMEERERAAELEEWVTHYVPLVVRFEEEFKCKVQMVDLGGVNSYVQILQGEGLAPNQQEMLDEFFRRVDKEDKDEEERRKDPSAAPQEDKGKPTAIEEAIGLIHTRNRRAEFGRGGRGLMDVEEEAGREWRGFGDAEETIKLILNARAPKGYDVAVHRGDVPGMELKSLVDVAVADVVEMAEGNEVYEEIVKMLHETMGEKQCK